MRYEILEQLDRRTFKVAAKADGNIMAIYIAYYNHFKKEYTLYIHSRVSASPINLLPKLKIELDKLPYSRKKE